MTNIVMLVRNRPNLVRQALDSLWANTERGTYNVLIVDDASDLKTRGVLDMFAAGKDEVQIVRLWRSKGIVGLVRNLGIRAAETYWGRGDLLYLSDSDACFLPGWLEVLTQAFQAAEPSYALVAGYTHPYHQPIEIVGFGTASSLAGLYRLALHDAIGGFSQLMRWETWDRFGPFAANEPGVCRSEDWAFVQKIRAAGYKVGCIHPHMVLNTGCTNTLGQPALGHEVMVKLPGVLYE